VQWCTWFNQNQHFKPKHALKTRWSDSHLAFSPFLTQAKSEGNTRNEENQRIKQLHLPLEGNKEGKKNSIKMVDVAQWTATLPPLHPTPTPLRRLSGLRRLSVRASSAAPSTPSRSAVSSFTDLASSILSHLSLSSVLIKPGLSDSDLLRIESELSITFPPDLRTLLSLGLPSGNGFPNWHQRPLHQISNLPLKRTPLLVSQSSLRKAPLLVPVHASHFVNFGTLKKMEREFLSIRLLEYDLFLL
jgi:hypothetical protein